MNTHKDKGEGKKICHGYCKCPDCHVLADKFGNIPTVKEVNEVLNQKIKIKKYGFSEVEFPKDKIEKDKKKKEKKIEIWKLYPGPLRKWMKGLK